MTSTEEQQFREDLDKKLWNATDRLRSNPITWRLAAMNMAIRGISFNFGKQPAGSFFRTSF